MPAKEGWKPINEINGFSVAQAVLGIALRTPEKLDGDAAASNDKICMAGFCAPSPGGFLKAFQA